MSAGRHRSDSSGGETPTADERGNPLARVRRVRFCRPYSDDFFALEALPDEIFELEVLTDSAGESTLQVWPARCGRALPEEAVERAEHWPDAHERHRQDNGRRDETGDGRAPESASDGESEGQSRGESC